MKQNIDVVSTIQMYPIGFGIKMGNRVYHYAHAEGTLVPDLGAKVKNPQDISQEALGAAASAGDTSIVLTLDNTDGPTYNGLLPQDYLKGGTVVIFPAGGNKTIIRGIKSNTAVTVNPSTAHFTVTLDAPIPCDLTIADVAEAIASPYKAVVPYTATKLSCELSACCGIPSVPAVDGDYLWLQTAGPTWAAPDAGLGVGANNREAVFGGDGALASPKTLTHGEQRAGYVMGNDKGDGQGAPFVFLDIDPMFDVVVSAGSYGQ